MKKSNRLWYVVCLLAVMMLCTAFSVQAAQSIPIPDYLRDGVIVHACGGLDGFNYTNSVEALEKTLGSGAACVEIDFSYTSDGVLVCNHGWKDFRRKAPTWKQFKRQKTIGGFTPMTAKTALKMLIQADSTWLVLDTQEKDVAAVYKDIIRICKKNGGKKYLEKIVPQLYDKSEYKKVRKLYPFRQWIFTLYKLQMKSTKDYMDIANFCRKNGIQVITMANARLNKTIAKKIHKKGILVAVHTVNTWNKGISFFEKGADAIYSDILR